MEENSTAQKNTLSVPLAIVVAGALIAGALFFSRGGLPESQKANIPADTTEPYATQALSIRAISGDDHILGNPSAPVAIVVYTDTECPFCKTFHSTMQRIADAYGKDGKVLWVYRHFPLEQLHPKAQKEHEATECAAELGGKAAFWDYVNKLFQVTPSNNGLDAAQLPIIADDIGLDKTTFTSCLSSGRYEDKVMDDYTEAINAGGRGTPYSIMVVQSPLSDATIDAIKNITMTLSPDTMTYSTDKRRIGMSGALPYSMVQKIVDALLNN